MTSTSILDPNDAELEHIQQAYELLEPLLDDYLGEQEKRAHAQEVRQRLQISERTLRRYLKRFREKGVRALGRKKRCDAGKPHLLSAALLERAQQLLKQNPARSVPMLLKLLCQEPGLEEQAKRISPSTLYFHLRKAGHTLSHPRSPLSPAVYHRFQAEFPNQLWQGDARHGFPLPDPRKRRKTRMTYLFAWVDDFSRKIMEARYYWDEKLPRMEDCFRRAVLRWGHPDRVYCDNGNVYISHHFLLLVTDLGMKKIHHPAYCAWCKGKVENVMKSLKRFQSEAALAGIKTLEELNATLSAWVEVEYNSKLHSSSGETPNERWANNLAAHPPKRIADLDVFNALFLWRDKRSIDKFGQIRFQGNRYRIHGFAVGSCVELRYNPFDLCEVSVFHEGRFHATLKATTLTRTAVLKVPEEKKDSSRFSPEAAEYFRRIREKATELTRQNAESLRYADIPRKERTR